MGQKEKILDILGLAALPEDVKVARLASQKVGKVFTMDHALAVVRTYFDKTGRTREIAQKLFDEKHRQERIHNDRQAVKAACEVAQAPYARRFVTPEARKHEHIRHAQNLFGRDIENNFGEDNLALMSLIQGDIRRYRVTWLDGGSRPRPSALIEVGVLVDGIFRGQHRVLLYKHGGRTLVAGTDAGTVRDAFAEQVPSKLVELAADLKAQGCKIETDFGTQEMVVTTPEGDEKRLPWTGRTVDS